MDLARVKQPQTRQRMPVWNSHLAQVSSRFCCTAADSPDSLFSFPDTFQVQQQ
jgi:hypothetical protein